MPATGGARKVHWRQRAIDSIRKDCADSGNNAVVTGHFMLWVKGQEAGSSVYTQKDIAHIL